MYLVKQIINMYAYFAVWGMIIYTSLFMRKLNRLTTDKKLLIMSLLLYYYMNLCNLNGKNSDLHDLKILL